MGIGIHTGDATMGNIGTDSRADFTIVGQSLDLTAIIEELNDQYQTSGLISESTFEAVKEDFQWVEVGDIQPQWQSTLVRLFTLHDFMTIKRQKDLPSGAPT